MLSPKVEPQLEKMEKYVGNINACVEGDEEECREQWGQLGVYRVMFGASIFHLALALLLIGVRTSRDARSGLQNGMWFFKILALLAAMVGAFFIPNSFFIAWGWIGLIGAFVFMIIQLILLVDFAHSWNESWVAKAEDGSKCHSFGLLAASILFYLLSFTGTVLMYVYYTKASGESCGLSKFFISMNLVLGIVYSVMAVHPRVQENLPSSGILQSSVVLFYTTYLTWSAVSGVTGPCGPGSASSTTATVIGAMLLFVSVAYSSLRTSSASQLGKLGMAKNENSLLIKSAEDGDLDDEDMRTIDNEKDGVLYSWSFFHLIFLLAALYLMEVLTDWAVIKDGHNADVHVGEGMASVWIKIVSSWIAAALYMWTLMAPICLPDRDFN